MPCRQLPAGPRARSPFGTGLAPDYGSSLARRVSGTGVVVTVAEEHGVPLVPDGQYLVSDPDCGRPTLWTASRGVLRDYPDGVRWRPVPPRFADLHGDARRDARADWYEGTYWLWRQALAKAVLADVDGAAEAFRLRAGSVVLPDPPDWGTPAHDRSRAPRHRRATRPAATRTAARQRRMEEQVLAAALREQGKTVRQIAADLGISKSTAARRAELADGVPAAAVAKALLLVRVGDLEAAFRQDNPNVDAERREAALADLASIREVLRKGLGL